MHTWEIRLWRKSQSMKGFVSKAGQLNLNPEIYGESSKDFNQGLLQPYQATCSSWDNSIPFPVMPLCILSPMFGVPFFLTQHLNWTHPFQEAPLGYSLPLSLGYLLPSIVSPLYIPQIKFISSINFLYLWCTSVYFQIVYELLMDQDYCQERSQCIAL